MSEFNKKKKEEYERYLDEVSELTSERWHCPKFGDMVNFVLCGLRQRNLPQDVRVSSCGECEKYINDPKGDLE